ncbi:MAG: hypothetical protein AB1424_07470 [Thermodesulfobacteriota bacterium]
MNDLAAKKSFFIKRFESKYRLRLHMSLILLATVGAGLLATRIMLALHLHNVVIRYPLAVLFAYFVFFICVKLWLRWIAPASVVRARGKSSSSALDIIAIPGGSGSSGGSSSTTGVFRGGGGDFGGGGASGSFEVVPGALAQSSAQAAASGVDAGGGAAATAGDAVADAASSLELDEKGCLVAVVLLVVAGVFLGAGIYLIYQAPFILSEAAFEFFLAAGLVRGARRLGRGDWMGSVFKATWIPLVLTLLLALLAGFLMHHYFPGVTRISELFAYM